MKYGQVVEHKIIFFFENHAKKEAGRLVPDLLLLFRKALYEVKASGLQFSLINFDSSQIGIQ